MAGDKFILLLFLVNSLHMATAPQPGLFFWKPRLGLDLSVPTTEPDTSVVAPNFENIRNGLIVLISGYEAGMSMIAVVAGFANGFVALDLNPMKSDFYNNSWRWFLRYFSMLPYWMSGTGGNFCKTHRVWKRRYYYMAEFLPKWMRIFFPWVDKESWDIEERNYKKFKKYSEPAFGKHFRFPSKSFHDWESEITEETKEGDVPSIISASEVY